MVRLFALGSALILSLPLWAGSITGKVNLTAGRGVTLPSHSGGVLVYVTGFEEKPSKGEAVMRQKNKAFWPKVLPVVRGQSVVFPNLDKIYHNVFSVSPITSFNLGQYRKGEEPKAVSFEKSGLVPVFCNIHPHMISYVAVLENRAFALTDQEGSFEIHNVPAGKFELHAWYEGAKRQTMDITVADGAIVKSFDLKVSQKRKKHKRVDDTNYPSKGFVYDE